MKNSVHFIVWIVMSFLWGLSYGQSLNSPESVVFDAPRNRYLISNAGNGTISAYNFSTYTTFASGLSSPKGMVIVGNNLFVTDVTKVMGYNLTNGSTVMNLSITGASSLNDITSDNNQYLYISDMNSNTIIRVNYKNSSYSTFVSTGLNKPNGLLYDGTNNRLIVCSFINNSPIQAVNLSNGTVGTIVTTTLNNLDGLARDDSGFIYVSSWGTNAIYRFNSSFSSGPVQYASGYNGPADIYYNTESKVLAIPSMNNSQLYFIDMLYPVIYPQGKTDICPGGEVIFNTVNGSALSYVWKRNGVNVGTLATYHAIQGGSYTVTVTNHNGSKTSAPVQVNVFAQPPVPNIQIYGNTSFCLGDSVILEGPAGYSYLWSDSQTTRKIVVKKSGIYSLVVIDTNGCRSNPSGQLNISRNPIITKPVITSTKTQFCKGDSAVLSGPSGYNYIWSNGKTTEKIIVKDNLKVSLIIYDNNYCQSYPSDSVKITVFENPPKPKLDIQGNTAFCKGDSVLISAPKGYAAYLWNNMSINDHLKLFNSDTLFVMVTDSNGCSSPFSDTAVITVFELPQKPVITFTGKLSFCDGDSVILKAPPAFSKYYWNNQEGPDSLILKNSDTVVLFVVDQHGCKSLISDKVITVKREKPVKPEIIIVYGSVLFCKGDSIQLSTNNIYPQYLWSNGAKTRMTTVKTSDTLYVRVIDQYGCDNQSDKMIITALEIPAKPQVLKLNSDSLYSSVAGTDYKWFYNQIALSFNTRAIPIIGDGKYRVIVVNGICPSDTSDEYIYQAGNINEPARHPLTFYPNPAHHEINLLIPDNQYLIRFRLFDISGKLVWDKTLTGNTKQLKINLPELQQGTYIAELKTEEQKFSGLLFIH